MTFRPQSYKKETDASGKVYEQGSEAQATSVSKISVADLLNLVKGDVYTAPKLDIWTVYPFYWTQKGLL